MHPYNFFLAICIDTHRYQYEILKYIYPHVGIPVPRAVRNPQISGFLTNSLPVIKHVLNDLNKHKRCLHGIRFLGIHVKMCIPRI